MIEKGNNQPSKSEDCFPLMVVMELNLSTNNILFIDVLEKDIRYAISKLQRIVLSFEICRLV